MLTAFKREAPSPLRHYTWCAMRSSTCKCCSVLFEETVAHGHQALLQLRAVQFLRWLCGVFLVSFRRFGWGVSRWRIDESGERRSSTSSKGVGICDVPYFVQRQQQQQFLDRPYLSTLGQQSNNPHSGSDRGSRNSSVSAAITVGDWSLLPLLDARYSLHLLTLTRGTHLIRSIEGARDTRPLRRDASGMSEQKEVLLQYTSFYGIRLPWPNTPRIGPGPVGLQGTRT